jgi:hydroxymethylpyrimidine pyrophosphatase-like HAD family hydrolase
MRYLLLATDYDGTLAHHGTVSSETIASVERFRRSGRKLVLVTGRILSDLKNVFSRLDLFDRVVAENGATLYSPEAAEERLLAQCAPQNLVTELRARNVPLGVGRCILQTTDPYRDTVCAAIRKLGIDYEVIFNKGAVMVLPAGVNKGTGLKHALADLHVPESNVVAIGDAENDDQLLLHAGFSVAVANALAPLREHADLVTRGAASHGVQELIAAILHDDLRRYEQPLSREQSVDGETSAPS